MKFPGTASKIAAKIKAAIPPWPVCAAVLVVMLVFSWFVTEGTWQFSAPLNLGFRQFFDYQANSLLQGRLDVPPEAIGYEAFVYNGKSFGYFGIGPSLLRIPLNYLFPSLWGKWNELSLLAGCLVNLLAAYWIYRELSRHDSENTSPPARPVPRSVDRLFSVFILVFGLGSTNIFLSSHASIYHEPIMLGGAFCLLSCLFFLKFMRSPSLAWFSGLLLFGFLAFFTRVTAGLSAMLLIGLLLGVLSLKKWLPSLHSRYVSRILPGTPPADSLLFRYIALALLYFLLVASLYFWVNQTKFGTWVDDHSYKNYALVKPDSERYQRTDGGKSFFIQNYPMMASAYFFPLDIQVVNHFPPLITNQIDPAMFPYARYDNFEATDPLTLSMPFEFILAGVGLFSLARDQKRRVVLFPVLSTATALLVMLGFNSASQRYEHDFFPFFLLSAVIGFLYLTGPVLEKKKQLKHFVLAALLLLGLISIHQSLALTFTDQRNGHFVISAQRISDLKKMSNEIDQGFADAWRSAKKIIQPLRPQ